MIIGILAIALAFTASIVAITSYILYHRDGNEAVLKLANRSWYVMGAGILFSIALLIYSIMTHNFQVNFVYSYSSTILNKFYLFATLWAGQEGTFLLWLFYGSIYGFILIATVAKRHPLVMVFVGLVQSFILLILLQKSPFAMIWHVHEQAPVGFMPVDGAGLNPLLQNPWMVIHPPTLFVGYSSTVVAFAFAMAGMVTRNKDWIKPARPWIIFNVMVLGTGLIMGGYWAYTTLGWGGYWGWDPVENASLVPWLMGIVLLHGVVVQAKRDALVKTNMFLAGAVFLTMVWGSFLTRSGILTDFSVHSFGESGLHYYLVLFQGLFTLLFVLVFFYYAAAEAQNKPANTTLGSGMLNRETFMWLGMMIVLFNALFVLIGTSSPIYTRWFGDPSSVSPDFYNTMIVPVAVFLMVTVSIAPLLAWNTSEFRNGKTIGLSALAAAVLTSVAALLGLREGQSIFLVFLALVVIIVNARVASLLIARNSGKAGGYLAHVGIGFMIIGIITSSVYDTSEKVMLPKGEFTATDFGYQVKFVNFVDMPDGRDRVKLEVQTAEGSYEAYPQFYYSDYSKAYMVSPDVKIDFARDIYISPISFTPSEFADQKHLTLRKGESTDVQNMLVKFHDFSVEMGADQVVTANLTVEVQEGSYAKTHQVKPVLRASDGKMDSQPAEVADTGYKVRINAVNANEGSVDLSFIPPAGSGGVARDMLAIEVTEKPLISILWFGTIIFIGGILTTLVGHLKTAERTRNAA